MFRKQLVKHSLAVVAAAAAVVLTAPGAHAADEATCGRAGTDAVWRTIVTEPTYRTVAAVSHDEWRWQREVITEVATEDEYLHQVTGKVRWERPEWGAQNGALNGEGKGWVKTGASRAVTETTHEETDATSTDAPEGPDWTAIEESRVTVEDSPAYDELVTAGSEEQVLVTPAVAATEPCEETAIISDGGPRVDDDGDVVAGPQSGTDVAPVAEAAAAPVTATTLPRVLPNTGGVADWMTPVGVGTVLGGAALAFVARRRHA